MNICDDCPNPTEVERRRKCFDCIGGDEPLDTEVEIVNAPQHTQVEMPNLCNVCDSRGIGDCDNKQGSMACWQWLVRHFNHA